MKKSFLFYLLLLITGAAFSQDLNIQRVDPPYWWVGMKNPNLQVLVYGPDIAYSRLSLSYPGVSVGQIVLTENPNYLFLNLIIAPEAKAGVMPIVFTRDGQRITIEYELKNREGFNNRIQGLDGNDLVYLIMPDRFANGDKANDLVPEMLESTAKRTGQYTRHGGDLQGIIQHLDYLQGLGVTALWLNPVWENNQPKESYHGYAATDLYRVDPRLGDNALYTTLANELHRRGMKLVTDIVHNHVGNETWFYKDLPSANWVHQFDTLTRTNYRSTALMDPYASERDLMLMKNGWFDAHMPDLNQQDPLLANYMIQNNIWWVEQAGIDAYRVDTYPYPDQGFMDKWNKAMLAEYPQLSIFGETWVQGQGIQSYFTQKEHSGLPACTDFQLYDAITQAVTKPAGWDEGLGRLYQTLSQDYLYADPYQHVTFLDNHDVGRYFSSVNEDLARWKMGIAMLFTLRGIPQVYYGTEILMKNYWDGSNHDKVREEFPGGWPGDKVDKFKPEGRTPMEKDAFNYFQKLAQFRGKSEAIGKGKLMQFIPENGTYIYFRYTGTQTVMVAVNTNEVAKPVALARFAERLGGFGSAKDVVTGTSYSLSAPNLNIPAKTVLVLELAK